MGHSLPEEKNSNVPSLMIAAGSVLAGSGVMTLLWGFHAKISDAATGVLDYSQQISTVGYSGIDEVTISSAGFMGIGMAAVGVALMVTANRMAWKYTGGY